MKKHRIITAAVFLAALAAFPAHAGQWKQDEAGWTYEQDSGELYQNSWFEDSDGKWYYFGETGHMMTSFMTPDGYVTGPDGAYIPGMGQDHDMPVSPWNYQQLLGHGMDVDWSKTRSGQEAYTQKTAADFRAAGIRHVRIRVKDDWEQGNPELLDRQIDDCLSHGLIPVLACQADEFKNNPGQETADRMTEWWRTAAERYQSKSHLLAFDLMIESSDELNKNPDILNLMIEQTVTAIRETNPDRILIMSPRLRSDPAYLSELKIPSAANGYMMAEWHFYASGPSKTNERKLWTTGTDHEKRLITDKISYALAWQKQTGIPTWVGAWMAGNYNDGNDYSLEEQMQFAEFMCGSLDAAKIPFAVNSDTKFYDRDNGQWVEEMTPLRDLIYR